MCIQNVFWNTICERYMKNVWSTPTHAKMLKLVIMKKVIYENNIAFEQISTSEQRLVTKAKYFASFLFMNWKLEPDSGWRS